MCWLRQTGMLQNPRLAFIADGTASTDRKLPTLALPAAHIPAAQSPVFVKSGHYVLSLI